MISYIMISK